MRGAAGNASNFSTRRVLVGLARDKDIGKMVRAAVELSGGLPPISASDSILIKPNVCSYDPPPATTSAAVVGAVVQMVMEGGARQVVVADLTDPEVAPTIPCMERLGIYRATLQAGAKVISFEDGEWVQVHPEGASRWQNGLRMPRVFLDADYIITLPVLKTHFLATYSMALKNTVGAVHPDSRRFLHRHSGPELEAMIAEINLPRPPDFVIIDGTRALLSGGPFFSDSFPGEVAEPSLVIATHDLVAADVTGLAILKYLGSTPKIQKLPVWAQPQISRAVELGLGVSCPEDISLAAKGVPELDEIREFLR